MSRDAKGLTETPLLDALFNYRNDGVIRFHMPGHKGGRGAHSRMKALMGDSVYEYDVTGVEGMDDLHTPQGVIQRAERLAAETFGADHSFFLVNGTSSGIQAMILSTCKPGDRVIMPRNIHKSILSALILCGADPVFIHPEIHREMGIPLGVPPDRLIRALEQEPGARAAMVINPTYHGVSSDLRVMADATHELERVFLVDEAHGPHFKFHPSLPPTALESGADMCAQGVHKILSGLTQSSILHLREGRVDPERVRAVLRVLTTTSASYILMASIEGARLQMATEGKSLLERAISLAEQVRAGIGRIPGYRTFGTELVGRPGVSGLDPTKVTVSASELGITGHQLEIILRYRYHIQVEMSDLFNVLLIVGFGNHEEDVESFLSALAGISSRVREFRDESACALQGVVARVMADTVVIPEKVVPPREAFFAPSISRDLNEAVGCVCAEVITCYPPGIPLICPGERVTREVVDLIKISREAGLRFSGPRDPGLTTIHVL